MIAFGPVHSRRFGRSLGINNIPPKMCTYSCVYCQLGRTSNVRVEHLVGYEGNTFAFTGDVEDDLLSISAIYPMREDSVSAFLARAGAEWAVVHRLVAQDHLAEAEYESHRLYLKSLGKHS
jgi:wyosine [tRNA(Phe)-imidazoG37] synthetase (radical SAM superfamily)